MGGTAFTEGVRAAEASNQQNPFNIILSQFQDAQARRYKEDQMRREEEMKLHQALQVLSYKNNYDMELQKAQAEEDRKSGLLEQQTKGVVKEVPAGTPGAFDGTPFKMVGKTYSAGDNPDMALKQENLKYMQNINKQMGTGDSNANDIVYRNITGQEVPADIAQKDIAQGNTNYMIFKKEVTKSGMKETAISKPDDLQKIQQQKEKSKFVQDSAVDTLNTIQAVEKGINNFGFFGAISSIPGTERANWEANVNKLLSSKVITLMTSMKEASKTGATGFGQLSEKELKVLQEASTALKRNLPPKDAQKYLNDMKTATQKIMGGKQGGQIMVDAQGNKAMVYSDGTFDEVQ